MTNGRLGSRPSWRAFIRSIAVVACLVLLGTEGVAAQSWSTQVVDAAAGSGFFSSLAYNPANGFPAIAYSAPAKGNQASVNLAEWNGASWAVSTVFTGRGFNGGISLAFDPSGNPGVIYTMGGAKFSKRAGSSWSASTIDGQANATVASLVYSSGSYWAVYYTDKALKLGHLVGPSWSTETVDGAGMSYPSLAFAPDGNPSVAYRFGTSTATLRFAHKNGASWTVQNVETGYYYGLFTSLAYDPLSGNPTIAHGIGTAIRFVRWDGSQWAGENAATGYTCTHESLAYDAGGLPAISYDLAPDGSGAHELHIARRTGCSGTCWTDDLIENVAPLYTQWRTSIAFAPTGLATIAYGVADPQILKFAQQLP